MERTLRKLLGACLNGLVEMRMGGRKERPSVRHLSKFLGRKWGEERVFEGGDGGVDGGESLIPTTTRR